MEYVLFIMLGFSIVLLGFFLLGLCVLFRQTIHPPRLADEALSQPAVREPIYTPDLLQATRRRCPQCAEYLGKLYLPMTRKQIIFGGWTCPACGTEYNAWGNRVRSQRPHNASDPTDE